MNRITTLTLSLALIAAPLLFLAASPASAHICRAQDPATSCGECRSNLFQPYHDHNYNNGSNYCNSVGYLCASLGIITCDIGSGVKLLP